MFEILNLALINEGIQLILILNQGSQSILYEIIVLSVMLVNGSHKYWQGSESYILYHCRLLGFLALLGRFLFGDLIFGDFDSVKKSSPNLQSVINQAIARHLIEYGQI